MVHANSFSGDTALTSPMAEKPPAGGDGCPKADEWETLYSKRELTARLKYFKVATAEG
jgi:hypothetical protein